MKGGVEIFISKSQKEFPGRFDYHLTRETFINYKNKTKMTCIKHELDFEVRPGGHLKSAKKFMPSGGCPRCYSESKREWHATNNIKEKLAEGKKRAREENKTKHSKYNSYKTRTEKTF